MPDDITVSPPRIVSKVFYNCFLRIFGDGGFGGPDPPDGGCDDCGGGCTGEGCGCTDCDPGDDPCDDIVVLAECPPGYQDLDVVNCIERSYTKQQLVDSQCIQRCEDPVNFNCNDCILGFAPNKCSECCPSNPPPPPGLKECVGYYCASVPCLKPYDAGGCVESFTTSVPVNSPCPNTWNGATVYDTFQKALQLEFCYSTDPGSPTTPGGGGGGGGGGAPGAPPIGASLPCTLYNCIIISSNTDPRNPDVLNIDRECVPVTQTVGAWYNQFVGGEITGPVSCDTIKGVAANYGYYKNQAVCESQCQDEILGSTAGGGGGDSTTVFVCENNTCEQVTVSVNSIDPNGVLVTTGQQTYPDRASCQSSSQCCTQVSFRFWRCDITNECECVDDVVVQSCTIPQPPAGSYQTKAECEATTTDCCRKDTDTGIEQLANLYPFDLAGNPPGGIPMGYCAGESVTIEPSDVDALALLSNEFAVSFNASIGIDFDVATGNINISNQALSTFGSNFQLVLERDCCDDTQPRSIDVLVSDITRELSPDNPLCDTGDPGDPDVPGDLDGQVFPDVSVFDGDDTTGGGGGGSTGGPGNGTSTGEPGGDNPGGPGTGNNRVFNNTGAGGATFSYDEVLEYADRLRSIPDSDLIFDPLVEDRIYRMSTSYNEYTPVQNPGYDTHILGGMIHASVYYAYRSHITGSFQAAFDDLGGPSLLKSLRPEIQEAVKNARDVAGQSLTNVVLDKIAHLIRVDRLNELDSDSLLNLNSGDYTQFGITGLGMGSENNALRFIDDALKPLFHEAYSGEARDRMRVWKTVAPDVNKHIALIQRDGTLLEHPISIDDKYFIQYGAGSIQEHSILDGDYFNYYDKYNSISRGGVFSDIARAFMLDLKDAAIANKLLGSSNDVTLIASSIPVARIEETSDLSTAHPEAYYLRLIPSSIEDVDRDRPLIRKSTCRFRWEQDSEAFNNWIKFKPWPYLVISVDHEDPFLDHLNHRKSINAIFRDVSFDYYKGYEDEYPIIPRRIPWYIIIVPTDDPGKTIQYASSRLVDYSIREINVSMLTPLGSGNKKPMRYNPPGITISQSPPTQDVDLDTSRVGGVEASVEPTTIPKYRAGSEPLPRRPSAFRSFMESVRNITDTSSYIDPSTSSASWGDVYKQLDQKTKNALKRTEVKEWNKLKELYAQGRPTPSTVINQQLPKLFRVPPRGISYKEDFQTPKVSSKKLLIYPDSETPSPL